MSEESSVSFIVITVILTSIVLGTIIGNFFVISAILVDKNLQTTANQLVLSLAISDLMVACLVMPLGAYNDIYQGWYLSKEICEFWTSADVLCCTASILNLLAIALDRYWAVTNVDYIYRRTRKRVNIMILCAWTVGAGVSLAPIFGWKDPDFASRVLQEHKCLVSQDVGYQVFATVSSFYAPLVLLLALYWRIFQVARKRIRTKPGRQEAVQRRQLHQRLPERQTAQVEPAEKQVDLARAINYLPKAAAAIAPLTMATTTAITLNSSREQQKDKDDTHLAKALEPAAPALGQLTIHSGAQTAARPSASSGSEEVICNRKEGLSASSFLTSRQEVDRKRCQQGRKQPTSSPSPLAPPPHRNWHLEAAPTSVRWRQKPQPSAAAAAATDRASAGAESNMNLQAQATTCGQRSNCSDGSMIENATRCNFKRNSPSSSSSCWSSKRQLHPADWMQLLQLSNSGSHCRVSPSVAAAAAAVEAGDGDGPGDGETNSAESAWCCYCCCCRQCAQVQLHTSQVQVELEVEPAAADLESGLCVHCGVDGSAAPHSAGIRQLKRRQPAPQINHPDRQPALPADAYFAAPTTTTYAKEPQMKKLRGGGGAELSSSSSSADKNIDKAHEVVASSPSSSAANTFGADNNDADRRDDGVAVDENSNSAPLAQQHRSRSQVDHLPPVEQKLSLIGCLHLSVSQQRCPRGSRHHHHHHPHQQQQRRHSSSPSGCSTSESLSCLGSARCAVATSSGGQVPLTSTWKRDSNSHSISDLNSHSAASSPSSSRSSPLDNNNNNNNNHQVDDEDDEPDDDELDVASLSASFPPPIELLDARRLTSSRSSQQQESSEQVERRLRLQRQTDELAPSQPLQSQPINPSDGLADSVLPTATTDNGPTVADDQQQQQQQQMKKRRRSLDIRRRFRAIGQLVSFVQTSANLRSSSSQTSHLQHSSTASQSEAAETPHLTASPADGANSCPAAGTTVQVFNLSAVCGSVSGYKSPGGQVSAASGVSPPLSGKASSATTGTPNAAAAAQQPTGMAKSHVLQRNHQQHQHQQQLQQQRRRQNMDIKREKKAAKTLAIITGVFVCCWLPFFLNAIVMPICGPSCTPSDLVLSILLWLGYLNSLLNPIIYTIFSPDFRRAFRRLLCLPRLVQLGTKLKQQQPPPPQPLAAHQQQLDCQSMHSPLESGKK